MKPSRVVIAVLLAAALGYAAAVLGTLIEHRNESTFGGAYRQFQHEWLCIPSIPGFLLAELHAGYDCGVDEAWSFRHDIRLLNAAFWSVAVFIVATPFAARYIIQHARAQREADAPTYHY
jgi:hypothetical protein